MRRLSGGGGMVSVAWSLRTPLGCASLVFGDVSVSMATGDSSSKDDLLRPRPAFGLALARPFLVVLAGLPRLALWLPPSTDGDACGVEGARCS